MIRINLLTSERGKIAKATTMQSGQKLAVGCSLILVLAGLFIGWRYWSLSQQSTRLEADISAAQKETERLHSILNQLHREQRERPRVLVEAPTAVVNQEFEALPPGVQLSPGRIVLDGFSTPDEAKQKLLALIMAMGNDPDGFDARITGSPQ